MFGHAISTPYNRPWLEQTARQCVEIFGLKIFFIPAVVIFVIIAIGCTVMVVPII
jgi:TRAP-type mannitol/chloroaromatic compound transport system permease small subunit